MGGSLSLAMQRARLVREVVGYSASPATLDTALETGVLHAAATGRLDEIEPLRWRDGSAVIVVLAADLEGDAWPLAGRQFAGQPGDFVNIAGQRQCHHVGLQPVNH